MTTLSSDLIAPPPNRAIILRNRTCIYCGRAFGDERPPTKEHVVGRRFVPRGCFDGQWNLIANACEPCNRLKADLEDDISAISMMPDLSGRFAIDDPRLAAEAQRKAVNARSRRTGKAVAQSQEEIKLQQSFGGATLTFTLTAPAQVEEHRIFRLAHYHFGGFFYYITYRQPTQAGGFIQGGFYPLTHTRRADWGNPRMRWFMELVRGWDLRVHAIGADTFFKKLIRKHPEKDVWAWAVEWNHSMCVIGFAGDKAAVQELTKTLPPLEFNQVHEAPNRRVRMRIDIPLPEGEDDLFSYPIEAAEVQEEDSAIEPVGGQPRLGERSYQG